ncbi:MAG: hypothetical protein CMQ40_06910 [Gammaproteobacteria bacterium]|nr:hypothetical protein [Gammaproteobacteria bacterium]
MAEVAIKQEKKVKGLMPYNNTKSIEDEEKELKEMEEAHVKVAEADVKKVEQEIAELDENLSAEEKSFKKRYGDLRRHTQKKEQEFQTQLNELKAQLAESTKQNIKLPKTEEEIDAWAKEYPDVAGIVETIATKKAMEQSKDLEARMKQINEMQSDAKREKAEAELLRIHPDFEEIKESDDFHDWADKQPKWVQNALYENEDDANSAARAIDLYKSDTGMGKKAKKSSSSDKDAAMDVKTSSSRTNVTENKSKIFRESEIAQMSDKEFEKHQDAILAQQREGKIILDMSRRS